MPGYKEIKNRQTREKTGLSLPLVVKGKRDKSMLLSSVFLE